MKKLPARYAPLLTALLVSLFMSCMVSGIATFKNSGVDTEFIERWMRAWAVSWVIAFPILLMVLPVVRRIVSKLVDPAN
jgi:hypothetical protein